MSHQPIKISTAADVLDVLPALLGFYPTESLCVLALDNNPAGGQTVALTARTDLPTNTSAVTQVTTSLGAVLHSHDNYVMVAYSLDTETARRTLQHLLTTVDPAKILTSVVAGPQGWTHLDPQMPDAVQWTNPYRTGPVAAQAAAAGLNAHGTRDDIRDSIASPTGPDAHAFGQAYLAQDLPTVPTANQTAAMNQDVTNYIHRYLTHPHAITAHDAAYLTALVQHIPPRDKAWSLMDRATGRQHATLWTHVAAHSPNQPTALPVVVLLGMAGWISGAGVLANLAMERAETIPGSRTYTMLGQVIDQAVPPTMWDQMVTDLSEAL